MSTGEVDPESKKLSQFFLQRLAFLVGQELRNQVVAKLIFELDKQSEFTFEVAMNKRFVYARLFCDIAGGGGVVADLRENIERRFKELRSSVLLVAFFFTAAMMSS